MLAAGQRTPGLKIFASFITGPDKIFLVLNHFRNTVANYVCNGKCNQLLILLIYYIALVHVSLYVVIIMKGFST